MHLYICYRRLTCRLDGLHIYLALASVVLIRVGRRGCLYFHKIYTRLLAQLAYANYWGFFITKCIV